MSEIFSIYSGLIYLSRGLNFQNDSLSDLYPILFLNLHIFLALTLLLWNFHQIYLLIEFSVSAHFLFEWVFPLSLELQWLEHLRNHENMFETEIVQANECYSLRQFRRYNRDISFRFSLIWRYVVCYHHNRLDEAILMSTQNIPFSIYNRKSP